MSNTNGDEFPGLLATSIANTSIGTGTVVTKWTASNSTTANSNSLSNIVIDSSDHYVLTSNNWSVSCSTTMLEKISDHKLDGPAYEIKIKTWRINGKDCDSYECDMFEKIIKIDNKENLLEYLLDKNENVRLVAGDRLRKLEEIENLYSIKDYLIS